MNLQKDRYCQTEEESDIPILFIADIPFDRCPQKASAEIKYLFGKIVAVQQGFIQPPEASIFWLSAIKQVMSATAIAAEEARKQARKK